MVDDSLICLLCGEASSESVPGARWPVTITSDRQPRLFPVQTCWCRHCGHVTSQGAEVRALADIYDSYALFPESDTSDHLIFGLDEGPVPRTELEARTLRPFVPPVRRGKFLDVGCNKGLMLRAFAREHPHWELHGHEISPHYQPALLDLLEPGHFHTGPLEALPGGLDVVTLLHTLEHIPDPVPALRALRERMSPAGILMVQVPDLRYAPGDLVVYDHLSHFVPETLVALVQQGGFEVELVSDTATPRELALVARPDTRRAPPPLPSPDATRLVIDGAVAFLRSAQRLVQETGARKVGVFGTGLLGSWVAGLLGARAGWVVDEATTKANCGHLGRKVLHPRDLSEGDEIILAVNPSLARTLTQRWRHVPARLISLQEDEQTRGSAW